MSLFVFGIGYTAGHYLRERRPEATGTVRSPSRQEALQREGFGALLFDGDQQDAALGGALAAADRLLVSAQPEATGDPVLERFGPAIAATPGLTSVVYLSTIGVYGDHGGGWIDEGTPPNPSTERTRIRLAVEQAWLDFGARTGKAVHVLRLAGIYGPGRNVLVDLAQGEARRIDKPGQVFNRIHVADIGRAIDRAFLAPGQRVWNVADDEPAPAPEVVAYAAELTGSRLPPLIPFADADLSPMARSFYGANRRVSNRALRRDLRVELVYPTYREGLAALWAAGQGRSGPLGADGARAPRAAGHTR